MLPLDLHVLGLPLAFILSQDQTLRCKNFEFVDGSFNLLSTLFPYFLICQRTFLLSNKTFVLITNLTYTSNSIYVSLFQYLKLNRCLTRFVSFQSSCFPQRFTFRFYRFGVAKVIKFLLLTSFCENIFELYFLSFHSINPSLLRVNQRSDWGCKSNQVFVSDKLF